MYFYKSTVFFSVKITITKGECTKIFLDAYKHTNDL